MLAEENMACIIHATGTGKSFITLQLIYDYIKEINNKRIIYVTPLNGIKDQIKEHIKNSNIPDDYFDNVEFLTYDALLNMTEEDLNNIGFVAFDEFHHIKAPRYNKQIELMMQLNKDMKIFGMSATSIRGLGTSKEEDVSMTFFKGNIASVYDLADAIVDGVLPAPNYHANLLYLIDSEISDMEEKLKTGNLSFEEKTAYLNDLNKMRQRLASSDEAKDMIRKHVKADGKYLYFAQRGSDIKQIKQDFLDSIPIEFRDNVEFYQVHSSLYSKQQNKLNADCFYNNISKDTSRYEIINGQKVLVGNSNKHKLRVMISIDMYNEGIHIPDLDGVIMGRNTKSDIVFFQQLGRALAVKMKENYNPLILDLAGNIREIIKLYKSVIKKGQSRAFPQNTTASDNYFRNIFGISQEVIDIIEEFDGLKERFISKNDLINRINYIYDTYKEKGVPKKDSTDIFPDAIGSAKIGPFLAPKKNKNKIIELANAGNQKAMWICQQKKWIKIIEAKQEFEESSNFKELKDNLDGKSKDDSKNLS